MDAQLWADIKRLYGVEKVRVSDIARRLRVDRKTVRRAIRSERLPVIVRAPRQGRLLSPYTGYLAERLKTYPRLPAPVLLEELKKQGYVGSLRILQDYLKGVRGTSKEVFLRIETAAGEEAQCDWANCGSVKIEGITRRFSAFVMVLSYSRLMYVEFTLSQCLEDFIQCHVNAFGFFGGVPKRILYDNLKAVVLSRTGSDIRFNPGFMEFSGVMALNWDLMISSSVCKAPTFSVSMPPLPVSTSISAPRTDGIRSVTPPWFDPPSRAR
jgi:transposase